MSNSHEATDFDGLCKTDSSQLWFDGVVRFNSTKYLTINANANRAPRLRTRRLVSKSANMLFQSVQKKQKATIQYGSPCSGMSELKIWVEAIYSDAMVAALAAFDINELSSENQLLSRTR